MKAVVAAFNQEKALVGAFSVITNLASDGTFSSTSTSGYNEDPVPRVARLCFLPSVGTALARMCASLDTFPRNACSRTLQPDIGSTFVTGIHLLYVILTCLR